MKLNENQKVTLTLGQLKRLVKETSAKKTYTKKQLAEGNYKKANKNDKSVNNYTLVQSFENGMPDVRTPVRSMLDVADIIMEFMENEIANSDEDLMIGDFAFYVKQGENYTACLEDADAAARCLFIDKQTIVVELAGEFNRKLQLAEGNYRKVNEDGPHGQIRDDVQGLLADRNDIPNYLKNRILELISDNAGYDGIEYDDEQVDIYANQFKQERVITLTAVKGVRKFKVNVPTAAVPLKVTPNQLLDYLAKRNPGATALYCDIEFDFEAGPYRFYYDKDFETPRERISSFKRRCYTLDLGEDGDAVQIYDPCAGSGYSVGSDGVREQI